MDSDKHARKKGTVSEAAKAVDGRSPESKEKKQALPTFLTVCVEPSYVSLTLSLSLVSVSVVRDGRERETPHVWALAT